MMSGTGDDCEDCETIFESRREGNVLSSFVRRRLRAAGVPRDASWHQWHAGYGVAAVAVGGLFDSCQCVLTVSKSNATMVGCVGHHRLQCIALRDGQEGSGHRLAIIAMLHVPTAPAPTHPTCHSATNWASDRHKTQDRNADCNQGRFIKSWGEHQHARRRGLPHVRHFLALEGIDKRLVLDGHPVVGRRQTDFSRQTPAAPRF